jgi:hypothetical protein
LDLSTVAGSACTCETGVPIDAGVDTGTVDHP